MSFIVMVLMGIPRSLVAGYVFAKLWGWFVVSTFNASPIGSLEAIGLMYVVSFMMIPVHIAIMKGSAKKPLEVKEAISSAIAEGLMLLFIGYPLILGFGYIWHLAITAWG